jgi:hypothetical protein
MKTFAAMLIVALMTAFAPAANAGPRYHRHHHHHGIRSSYIVPKYYNPYQYNYNRYSNRCYYPRYHSYYRSRPYYSSYPQYYARPHYYHYRTVPSVRFYYRW